MRSNDAGKVIFSFLPHTNRYAAVFETTHATIPIIILA